MLEKQLTKNILKTLKPKNADDFNLKNTGLHGLILDGI